MIPLKKIIYEARNNNEIPFNDFLEKTFKKLEMQLLKLTNSEADAREIFIESMQKFWEQFIVNEKEVPENPEGYIYRMCKNAWLIKKRNPWNKVVLPDVAVSEKSEEELLELSEKPDDSLLKSKSLTIALSRMSSKCKALIELGLSREKKLIDVMADLGYMSYQAIVQAKYNCRKRLVKEVFKVFNELKIQHHDR